jgi:hypothetical protein
MKSGSMQRRRSSAIRPSGRPLANSEVERHVNPTLYALCHKPVIGVALWLSTLCTFPPLLKETPIAVAKAGLVVSSAFQVPVAQGYFLSARFTFPSTQERISDTLVGARFDTPCYGPGARRFEDFQSSDRRQMGHPLRLRIMVKRQPSGKVAYSEDVASICRAGHDGGAVKTQVLSLMTLAQGSYSIEVHNLEPRPDLDALHPSLVLHAGGG